MNANYNIKDEYVARYPILVETAEKLQNFLRDLVKNITRIDSVTARAKTPDRYFDKALKTDKEGNAKYSNPRYGIQDQIGARINVLYLSDVERIRLHISQFLRYIEEAPKQPDNDAEFGYVGYHFIMKMPDDVISDDHEEAVPEFFELQIKTLFQHAWSETHHDLGYKAPRPLTSDERRHIAFTAAQAWGADKIFEEIASKVILND